MSKYHDDNTRASDAIPINMSQELYKRFAKELGYWEFIFANFRVPQPLLVEHMQGGDSRAAVVVKVEPHIVVAAYTDEIDCVAMLKFSDWVGEIYPLKIGTRLLTVNTYNWLRDGMAKDLTPGPSFLGQYGNFFPVIAEFVAENVEVAEARKLQIGEDEWSRTLDLAKEYIKRHGSLARNGNPLKSQRPADGRY